jgi:uncharacterized protein YbbK (DUF523 family)
MGKMPFNLEIVLASACLCGVTCRWHGKRSYKTRTIRELEAAGRFVIPICPEMLGGLPCPRPPVKTKRGRVFETDPETRSTFGPERTAEFQAGAAAALRLARSIGARRAYFCRNSPSCAPSGIAGRLLAANGIEVFPIW